MPAGGERMLLLALEIDEVDPVLPETESSLDRLDETRPCFIRNRQAILNDLHPGTEPDILDLGVGPNDFTAQPNAQVALLLEEGEEITRLGFWWNSNPKCDEDGPFGRPEFCDRFIRDGFRRFRPDLAAAARA